MKATRDLPRDPALPGLEAIHTAGLAGAMPALGLGGAPVELVLTGYSPGSRATLEVRAGDRHLALKAYAEDPAEEAALYEALAAQGLGGESGARVPPLVAWERDLRLLVIGWLEGPPANRLIKGGQAERAGELAARWLQRVASVKIDIGRPRGAADTLQQAGEWVASLEAADPALGTAGAAVAALLARAQPAEGTPRLVHGTFYDRHILDLGDGPGVIDWQRFGQGPLEVDAGVFLATLSRNMLLKERPSGAAARAEEAFLEGIAGLVDERALAWHWGAALLHLGARTSKASRRQLRDDWLARAQTLLSEATRLAEAAAMPDSAAVPDGVERLVKSIYAAAERAARNDPSMAPEPLAGRLAAALCALKGWTVELVLHALSTRRATLEELDQIRKWLDDLNERGS